MRLPVSVVIPTIQSREGFLKERCLPSVVANGELEVIVVIGDGNGSAKRNRGLDQVTRQYVLFVDDDEILRPTCVSRMLEELERSPSAAFVYSDYYRVVLPGVPSAAPAGLFQAGPFDVRRLKRGNYINTTSLVRRDRCPRWDEQFERFQDWDFWLSLVLSGGVGKYIPEVLYELWQIDTSVTNRVEAAPYVDLMKRKHKLQGR